MTKKANQWVLEYLDLLQKSLEAKVKPKSFLRLGIKYVYIIVFGALLSGIFTPLTLGIEFNDVIFGMLSIFLGLGGGVLILIGLEKNKLTILFVLGGLGMIFASLILIHEIAERSIIQF